MVKNIRNLKLLMMLGFSNITPNVQSANRYQVLGSMETKQDIIRKDKVRVGLGISGTIALIAAIVFGIVGFATAPGEKEPVCPTLPYNPTDCDNWPVEDCGTKPEVCCPTNPTTAQCSKWSEICLSTLPKSCCPQPPYNRTIDCISAAWPSYCNNGTIPDDCCPTDPTPTQCGKWDDICKNTVEPVCCDKTPYDPKFCSSWPDTCGSKSLDCCPSHPNSWQCSIWNKICNSTVPTSCCSTKPYDPHFCSKWPSDVCGPKSLDCCPTSPTSTQCSKWSTMCTDVLPTSCCTTMPYDPNFCSSWPVTPCGSNISPNCCPLSPNATQCSGWSSICTSVMPYDKCCPQPPYTNGTQCISSAWPSYCNGGVIPKDCCPATPTTIQCGKWGDICLDAFPVSCCTAKPYEPNFCSKLANQCNPVPTDCCPTKPSSWQCSVWSSICNSKLPDNCCPQLPYAPSNCTSAAWPSYCNGGVIPKDCCPNNPNATQCSKWDDICTGKIPHEPCFPNCTINFPNPCTSVPSKPNCQYTTDDGTGTIKYKCCPNDAGQSCSQMGTWDENVCGPISDTTCEYIETVDMLLPSQIEKIEKIEKIIKTIKTLTISNTTNTTLADDETDILGQEESARVVAGFVGYMAMCAVVLLGSFFTRTAFMRSGFGVNGATILRTLSNLVCLTYGILIVAGLSSGNTSLMAISGVNVYNVFMLVSAILTITSPVIFLLEDMRINQLDRNN